MATPTTIKAEYLRATAAEKALSDRIYALEHPAPPPVVTPPPTGTLQQIIDGVQAGGSVDLTGWTGSGGARITKPVTIKGGAVTVTSGNAVSVESLGVTLDGFAASGSKTAYSAVWATHADELHVLNCKIADFVYAGVMVLESVGGSVSRNLIQRIGVGGANNANAYGIAFSDEGGPATSDFLCDANVIEDVPTWQGINTHNGVRLTWTNNVVRRCRRAYWLAPVGTRRIVSCVVKGNRAESVPLPVYDPTAYFIQNSDGCSFIGNSMSADYPHPADGGEWLAGIRDYGNGSTGLVRSGTVIA